MLIYYNILYIMAFFYVAIHMRGLATHVHIVVTKDATYTCMYS